jgi:hypothetical protein
MASSTANKKKNKVYEFDYEWNGQAERSKGVNLKEQNPWHKPAFASVVVPTNNQRINTDYRSMEQAPKLDKKGMDKLKENHQWQIPEWATVKQKQQQPSSAEPILKDPIPKPMLKKTNRGDGPTSIAETEAAIAEMQRQIQILQAQKKKAASSVAAAGGGGGTALDSTSTQKDKQDHPEEQQQQQQQQRDKHLANETQLERARRLAKEREEQRWRATLKERNLRDAEKRRLARLQAASTTQQKSSDDTWKQTQDQQELQYQERVRQEGEKRRENEMAQAQAAASVVSPPEPHPKTHRSNHPPVPSTPAQESNMVVREEVHDDEEIEEEIVEEVVVEEEEEEEESYYEEEEEILDDSVEYVDDDYHDLETKKLEAEIELLKRQLEAA